MWFTIASRNTDIDKENSAVIQERLKTLTKNMNSTSIDGGKKRADECIKFKYANCGNYVMKVDIK